MEIQESFRNRYNNENKYLTKVKKESAKNSDSLSSLAATGNNVEGSEEFNYSNNISQAINEKMKSFNIELDSADKVAVPPPFTFGFGNHLKDAADDNNDVDSDDDNDDDDNDDDVDSDDDNNDDDDDNAEADDDENFEDEQIKTRSSKKRKIEIRKIGKKNDTIATNLLRSVLQSKVKQRKLRT